TPVSDDRPRERGRCRAPQAGCPRLHDLAVAPPARLAERGVPASVLELQLREGYSQRMPPRARTNADELPMGDPDSSVESTGESPESVADPTPPLAEPVHAPPARRYHRGHRRRLKRGPYRKQATAEAPITAIPVEKPVPKREGDEARRQFLAAQDEFLDLVGDDSDEASRLRTAYKRMVRKATHLQRCGPDCVQVDRKST